MIWSQSSLNLDPETVTFTSLGVFLPFWVGKDGQSLLELVISLPQVSQTLMTPWQAGLMNLH